ncbi:FecR domain-containing protein [Hydrogenophaga palleronii]|uniref:FecR domain-containing protein n=1 Tax=Hydrogenophaga palleronii TaxID=65655 RepID=UPI0008259A77|nr:FecR domain-containing protein [Hydrogenophaga palleronii]
MNRHPLPRPAPHSRQRLLTLSLAIAGLCLCAPVLAQQDLVHTVQPGDNLHDIAQRYLDDPRQWPELQRFNHVSHPRRLRPGSQLVIPAALARPAPASAEVLHVAGQASVRTAAQTAAEPLAIGAKVNEGAQIEVGDDGFVTLRLADGSLLRLAAGSSAQLRELRHAPASGQVQSTIQLERGRIDATVSPLPAASRSRFEVHTPRAIGGVRGTTFGVAVGPQGDFIGDVRQGAIHVQAQHARPGAGAAAMVRAGEGTRVGAAGTAIGVVPLLAAPDLSRVPAVLEDIAWVEVPLAQDTGAVAWQVRIARDAASEQVLRNGRFTQPLARFAGLEDGEYQLAVRALDAQGIPGIEAQRTLVVNARPQAPLLREPRAGSRLPAHAVELLCTEGSDAVGYRFQLARDAAFTDLVAQTGDLPQCRHKAVDLPPGAYHWRVASVARDAQGQRDQGPFSAAVPFNVVPLPPQPEAPSLRSEDSRSLGVAWSASPGGPWRHQIQLAHDDKFARLLDDQQLQEPAWRRSMPPPGTYHLRVRQIDPDGLQGAWSSAQRLEVHEQISTSSEQPLTSFDGQPVRTGTR